MPFGLVNAMVVWSRFLESVMADFLWKSVLCYADDCLVYTKSDCVDDHIRDVGKIFSEMQAHGIKDKASKLNLGLKEVPFLGDY